MAGWDKQRVKVFRDSFLDWLQWVQIASKDKEGYHPIKLYGAQKRLLNEIFAGLERDVHWFVILKARQLGCSTIVRCLIVFWAFMHKGLRVGLVYDSDANKEAARVEITQFLERLPKRYQIPVKAHPKTHLEFTNGSVIYYLVAGTKKGRTSGGLGRSRGVNCLGATEMSSWSDLEGLRALERSLSEKFENRLYIWESTARGFNIFYDLWREAQADDLVKKAVFLGWWSKEDYSIPKDNPLFDRYGLAPPTEDEIQKIKEVRERYGHEVTIEQLAWYRHEYDPMRDSDTADHAGQEIIQQEIPWTEDDAFILSGSQFFPPDSLSKQIKENVRSPNVGYNYVLTESFLDTGFSKPPFSRQAMLKVWEEPDPNGVYVVGADPAFGSSEDGDHHVAQVLRCYADSCEQVAEFCTNRILDFQFAWVLAHLCGSYGNARLLLELNGPGATVWNEFRMLQLVMTQGYLRSATEEKGLTNIFDNVKHYLWARYDALKKDPTAFHWKTSGERKEQVLTRLRDVTHTGELTLRSMDSCEEMSHIIREGTSIHGEGRHKDDRVMGLALAVRAWDDSERRRLIAEQRTRQNEMKRRDLSPVDLQVLFSERLVQNFFAGQSRARMTARRVARRGSRWNW